MPEIKINVTVNKVIFPPVAQPGEWHVLLTDAGKAAGTMRWRPEVGERLTLTGEWRAFRGERNFRFTSAIPNVPTNPRDLLAYVCHRTSGIGPALEQQIWDTLGAEWPNISEGDVPRLKGQQLFDFLETASMAEREAEKSQAISWLMGKGATVGMATSAWDLWGKDMVGVITNNCYRLTDLPHYGFVHVDGSIRVEFRIEDTDRRRVQAAILYAIGQLTNGGSTVIEWPALRDQACGLIGGYHVGLIAEVCAEMFQDGSLRGFERTRNICLGQDYEYENTIWEMVDAI